MRKTKIVFQRFVDREGNEVGHRTGERRSGHWAREKFLNRFYNLQYFEREEDKTVAVITDLDGKCNINLI